MGHTVFGKIGRFFSALGSFDCALQDLGDVVLAD
jgi:hypothetical protein